MPTPPLLHHTHHDENPTLPPPQKKSKFSKNTSADRRLCPIFAQNDRFFKTRDFVFVCLKFWNFPARCVPFGAGTLCEAVHGRLEINKRKKPTRLRTHLSLDDSSELLVDAPPSTRTASRSATWARFGGRASSVLPAVLLETSFGSRARFDYNGRDKP